MYAAAPSANRICLGLMILAASFTGPLGVAATIEVDPAGGASFTAIQPAVDAASDGDTLLLHPADYLIDTPLTYRGKAIRITSLAGPDATVIRMAEAPADTFRQLALRLIEDNHFAGDQELVTSPQDTDVWDPSFLAAINQALAGRAAVTLVQDDSVGKRAFVIRQGRKSVECSPAGALRARREEIEEQIASSLFGEGA